MSNIKIIPFLAKFQVGNIGKNYPLDYFIPVYHTVSDDNLPHLKHIIRYKNTVEFEKDLDLLSKDFQWVNWEEFKDFQNGKFKPKKKIALLTFDDGLSGFYDIAVPVLERKGIFAINFINPEFIDNHQLMFRCKASLLVESIINSKKTNPEVFKILQTDSSSKELLKQKILKINFKNQEKLNELAPFLETDFNEFLKNKKPYLDFGQLKTLSQKGFGISNHGWNHPLYHELTTEEQIENTFKSYEYLAEHQFLAESFAFPFTDFGVKREFFEKAFNNKNLFCSFGSAGIKLDSFAKNFQRIPMENGKNAEQILKEEICYFKLKKVLNKNIIQRE